MEMNQTASQARTRVLDARVGSLAGHPTTEYLVELSRQLATWQKEVESEISSAARREERYPHIADFVYVQSRAQPPR